MKTVNIILLQLMIATSITMSVVETAKFINDPKQPPHQIEEPVKVVKKIMNSGDAIKDDAKTQHQKEKILSYKTLLRCWNYITEDN